MPKFPRPPFVLTQVFPPMVVVRCFCCRLLSFGHYFCCGSYHYYCCHHDYVYSRMCLFDGELCQKLQNLLLSILRWITFFYGSESVVHVLPCPFPPPSPASRLAPPHARYRAATPHARAQDLYNYTRARNTFKTHTHAHRDARARVHMKDTPHHSTHTRHVETIL